MATGFPALMIQQPADPLKQFAEVSQIRAAAQESQMREVQLEEARLAQKSQTTLMQAFSRNNGDFNQTYADAAASGQVRPTDLLDFRAKSIAAQTQMATLQDKQLEVLGKQHDLAANEIESFRNLPVEQRTAGALQASMARLANNGVDVSKLVPTFQSLAQDPSDKNIDNIEIGLKGEQWLRTNEIKNRELANMPSTPEAEALRRATLTKTIEEGNKAAADTSLALERKRQLGQVTPEDTYKEQQANYRATLQRQTTFANELQKNGLSQLDKMFADPQHGYTQFIAQAQSTKNTIMQSRNGSELASSMEPLMLALGVTSFAGIHRINETEVNAAGPGAGSLYRKLNTILDKAGSGSVPEDTLKEASAIVDGLIDSKHSALINGAQMVSSNAGLDPKRTMVMDRSGVITTLDKAAEGNARHVETSAVQAVKPTHRYNPTTGQIEEIKQ